MTTCREIMAFIEKLAPRELAEDWDNVGLLLGSSEAEAKRVMLCLDITGASVKEAVAKKAQLIITHHPVIFKGLKRLIGEEAKGSLLYALVRNEINVYTAHTNLDFAVSGVNTQLAGALGLKNVETFGDGPGKIGMLDNMVILQDFVSQTKAALNVPFVRVVGCADKGVKKVAVFSGSFDDNLEAVMQCGVDVLVTGDLKYHTALDAREAGLCIIDAGHFNTERVVLPVLMAALTENFPGIEVFCFQQEEDPFKTY